MAHVEFTVDSVVKDLKELLSKKASPPIVMAILSIVKETLGANKCPCKAMK